MNEINEMFQHLGSCNQTIAVTRNTLKLADVQAGDYEEILAECQGNIDAARADLAKVRDFLSPETLH